MEGTLKILGSGTSTGVPVAGCNCQVCRSEDTKNKRLRASALISAAGMNILIDAGPDFRQQAITYNITHLNAVLFTHHHADHILGIDDLRAYNFVSGKALPIFLQQETLSEVSRLFHYIFTPVSNYRGGKVAELVPNIIRGGNEFCIENIRIIPFNIEHGTAACLGFRIGNLAYIADCKDIPSESKRLLLGLDTLIIDGLRYEHHPTHLSIPESIALADELSPKQTYLTHLTHTIDFQSVSETLPKNIALCYDGLQVDFSAA